MVVMMMMTMMNTMDVSAREPETKEQVQCQKRRK
jgi:hypothetical protein